MLGLDQEKFEATFDTWQMVLHPDNHEKASRCIDQAIENHARLSNEYRVIHPDGSIHWISAIGQAIYDQTGKSTRMTGICLDITARKSAEDSLAKSERFLKTVIDSEPECIKLLDADCNLLMMNPAGLEMIGADSLEQVKGQCVCPLITEPYRDDFIALTKKVFQGISGTLEFETIGLKGRHVWLETHAVPFRNEHDEIVALLGITRDITERKEAEEKVKRMNKRLEQMVAERTQELVQVNRDLSCFCYAISHELMAPVARLKGFSQMLQEDLGKNRDEALHCAERIAIASDKLQQVIDAVLQLSRLAQSSFTPLPLNLSTMVQEIANELVKDISGRQVKVVIADGIMATGDPQLLRLCLANLLGNALKYSARKAAARIEFGFDAAHGALFVRDNGIGFDMTYADKLFEPFIRIHQEDEFAGSGIGWQQLNA